MSPTDAAATQSPVSLVTVSRSPRRRRARPIVTAGYNGGEDRRDGKQACVGGVEVQALPGRARHAGQRREPGGMPRRQARLSVCRAEADHHGERGELGGHERPWAAAAARPVQRDEQQREAGAGEQPPDYAR